jgi:hypothetical protein
MMFIDIKGYMRRGAHRIFATVRAKVTYVIEWRNKTRTSGERKEEPMRTKRVFSFARRARR